MIKFVSLWPKTYNIGKKCKVLMAFDDVIPDQINKKIYPVVTELFIAGIKWNISIVFKTQQDFKAPKDVRLLFLSWKFQIK